MRNVIANVLSILSKQGVHFWMFTERRAGGYGFQLLNLSAQPMKDNNIVFVPAPYIVDKLTVHEPEGGEPETSDVFVDDDGYLTFIHGEIVWNLHSKGWEAFVDGHVDAIYCTYAYTFPTAKDLSNAVETASAL